MASKVFNAQRFVYCGVHHVVGHRSLLNRSGICDRIVCCNIFFVHTAVLSIQTVFNLVKIHLLIWNRHGHECSRIWKLSGNFTLIQFIKSVEIFWAEIYWGRLIFRAESSLIQSSCRSFIGVIVPYEISKVNFRVETKILVSMSEEI